MFPLAIELAIRVNHWPAIRHFETIRSHPIAAAIPLHAGQSWCLSLLMPVRGLNYLEPSPPSMSVVLCDTTVVQRVSDIVSIGGFGGGVEQLQGTKWQCNPSHRIVCDAGDTA